MATYDTVCRQRNIYNQIILLKAEKYLSLMLRNRFCQVLLAGKINDTTLLKKDHFQSTILAPIIFK